MALKLVVVFSSFDDASASTDEGKILISGTGKNNGATMTIDGEIVYSLGGSPKGSNHINDGMGEYIAKIYMETKKRPRYIIEKVI